MGSTDNRQFNSNHHRQITASLPLQKYFEKVCERQLNEMPPFLNKMSHGEFYAAKNSRGKSDVESQKIDNTGVTKVEQMYDELEKEHDDNKLACIMRSALHGSEGCSSDLILVEDIYQISKDFEHMCWGTI